MEHQSKKINKEAMFCDETKDYRIPPEPEARQYVTLRFRTQKDDVDRVCYVDDTNGRESDMRKVKSDMRFDYYEKVIWLGDDIKTYFFRIEKGTYTCYYNRLGATMDHRNCVSFCITPGFHTPQWAKGAVMYQIFVDRFCNGDTTNDVQSGEYIYIGRSAHQVQEWNKNPATMDVGCFYGGDLQGVLDKLDYLKYLGVEVLYLNPIFVSPSNHKYDCQDYDHIDPHYGVIVKDGGELLGERETDNQKATRYMTRTADPRNLEASDEFFARFVGAIHERGMKIILDGVFNHCGSFNKWLDAELIYEKSGNYEPGAYVAEDSPYHSFFKFYEGGSWPYNPNYDGWWGHATLPKLNYESSSKLHDYMMHIARKWVSPPYCIDGWRLDVAADLGHSSEYNHQFWRDFRKAVKEANPNAVILAEHYGDPKNWLGGDQWDTVMNYDAFMEPVTWFLTGMEKHSDEYNGNLLGDGESFFRSMNYHTSRMQTPSVFVAMNELSNHDHSRFLTRTNRTVGRIGSLGPEAADAGINYGIYREAVMIQMTWPGAPTLYYGDETGICGWTDPDNRRTYPWGNEDFELIEFHRYMIELHKRYRALVEGSVKQLAADRQLIAYGRMSGDNICVVVVNNRASDRQVELPVWTLGITEDKPLKRVMMTTEDGYNAGMLEYELKNGILKAELTGHCSMLFVTK